MNPNPPWAPSVTVAAVVQDLPAPGQPHRYLLIEEHTPEGLMLNNPAGHLDPGESPQEGAVREAMEETTCVFTPQALLGVYLARFQRPATGEDVTYVRFAYLGTAGKPDPARTLDDGIVRTLWLTLDEVRAAGARGRLRSPLVLRCLEDAEAGRRYALGAVTADATLREPEVKR
jgi:8-oxo-dGTP pyrophosphatase MutT (NUDIX family)